MVTYEVWLSQLCHLTGQELADDGDIGLRDAVRQRWLSLQANNTEVSIRNLTIPEEPAPSAATEHVPESAPGQNPEGQIQEGQIQEGEIQEVQIQEGQIQEGQIQEGQIQEGQNPDQNDEESSSGDIEKPSDSGSEATEETTEEATEESTEVAEETDPEQDELLERLQQFAK